MTTTPTVVISFKDIATDERVREAAQKQCERLSDEFRELTRIEITFSEDGVGFTAHAHVTGKHTEVATHASASEMLPAGESLFHKVERQLRKVHDKRIFAPRREARKSAGKKT